MDRVSKCFGSTSVPFISHLPLALILGWLYRPLTFFLWHEAGISRFKDLFEQGQFISFEQLQLKLDRLGVFSV